MYEKETCLAFKAHPLLEGLRVIFFSSPAHVYMYENVLKTLWELTANGVVIYGYE